MSSPIVQWCSHCGEGYTEFCRGRNPNCKMTSTYHMTIPSIYATVDADKTKVAKELVSKYRVFDDMTPEQLVRVCAALEDAYWHGVCKAVECHKDN